MLNRTIERFSNGKIQIIAGQRCVVKDQVVEQFVKLLKQKLNIRDDTIYHYNLDDILIRLDLEEDISSFKDRLENSLGEKLESLSLPVYFIFEQIQNAKNLFPFIANFKNINPQRINILLTSSINLTNDSNYMKYLSSVSEIHLVYPPILQELIEEQGILLNDKSILQLISNGELDINDFIEFFHFSKPYRQTIIRILKEYLLFGGVDLSNREQDSLPNWESIRSNLRDYFERVLVSVYQISDLRKFDQILRILAINNGNILNLLKMCDRYRINRNTMRKYSGILYDTFLIDYVPPFLKEEVNKPIMSTPKVYFYNNGLVNYLNGIHQYQMLENSVNFQSNLDAMLLLNLRATIAQSGQQKEITFLRDYQNHELDFLISTEKGLVPVGISLDDDNRKAKIKTFRYYLRYCQQIYHGVIFSTHEKVECIEMKNSKLYLLPIWMLW